MMGLSAVWQTILKCPGLVIIGFGLLLVGVLAGAALCAFCFCGDKKRPAENLGVGCDEETDAAEDADREVAAHSGCKAVVF